MTEAVILKIGSIVVVVVGYGLLRWRIMAATHDFRVRAGCDADRWAAREEVPESMQRALQFWADRMYRPATPWLVVLWMLVVVLPACRQPVREHDAVMRSLHPGIRGDAARLHARLAIAAVTTSPLASLATMLISVVGLTVWMSVDSLERRIVAIAGANWPGFAK